MTAKRYVRASCPKCHTVQIFNRAQLCSDTRNAVTNGDNRETVEIAVTCQNTECQHHFKLTDVDCRGY